MIDCSERRKSKESVLASVLRGVKHAAKGDLQEAKDHMQPLLERQSNDEV